MQHLSTSALQVLYTKWAGSVQQLLDEGDRQRAHDLAVEGVAAGVFINAWQRPPAVLLLNLPQTEAVHNLSDYPVALALERKHSSIGAEFTKSIHKYVHVPEQLTVSGVWEHLVLFYGNGSGWTAAAQGFPVIKSIIQQAGLDKSGTAVPTGIISFSRIGAHSKVAPHCGPSNIRARIHLGIQVVPTPTRVSAAT